MSSIPISDQLITPTTKYSFSPQVITLLLINLIIGSAPDKLGEMFKCGVILGPIVTIVIAIFTIISTFLITKSIAFFHLSTPDELVGHLFGRTLSIIIGLFTVIYYFLINVQYYDYISDFLKKIILYYQPDVPKTILDPYFLNSSIFILYIIPVIHTISLKTMLFFAIAAVISIIVIIVDNMYYFAVEITANREFNINNAKITYFKFDQNFLLCITQMTSFFLLYPFNYPGIRHLKHNSLRTWTIVCSRSILFSMIVFVVIGEFKYHAQLFHLPNENIDLVNIVSYASQLLLTLVSIPATMNPARYTMQNCFLGLKTNNFTLWYFFGYCFQTASFVMSSLYYKISKYVNLIITILASVLSLIIPPICYLLTFKFTSLCFAIISIILIIFGTGSVILNILNVLDVL